MKKVWAGLPRTINIVGQRFSVGTVKDLQVPVEDAPVDALTGSEWVHEGNLTVMGLADRDANVIALEAEAGYDKAREVLLHEVVHAAAGVAGLNKDVLHGIEESVVNRLSPILLAVIRDNPKLIEFLTDRRQGGAGSATYWRNLR